MSIQLGAGIFVAVLGFYVLATVCYVAYLLRRQTPLAAAGRGLLIAGLVLHTASLTIRILVTHKPPLLSLYEYMVAFTWGAVIVYLGLEFLTKNRSFGAFAAPLIAVLAYLTLRLPSDYRPPMPALESAWLFPHIGSAILAYGAFAVAFMLAIMFLLAERSAKRSGSFWSQRLPAVKSIDQAVYRLIAFGFLMQTLVVLVGAIWAQTAWGRFWGWDPKETWSLITWLIYAAFLHTRTTLGWHGQRSAWMAVIGFLAVIFTLFGVNFLLRGGLHSYF